MKYILHLSDLHFRHDKKMAVEPDIIRKAIRHEIKKLERPMDLHLCITGDLVFQNNKTAYDFVLQFLNNICMDNEIKPDKIILCPGNHDFDNKLYNFDSYNRFAFNLTRNEKFQFGKKSCDAYSVDNINYVVVNSMYHMNRKHGEVDLDAFREVVCKIENGLIVVCMHHHLIPTGEFSCLMNAYEFLRECISNEVNLILHGHRHMNSIVQVGSNRLNIFGAGTLFFLKDGVSGYTNQFQIISISDNKSDLIIFRYILDSDKNEYKYGFVPERFNNVL